MADFEQLKQKYQPVLAAISNEGADLQNVNMDRNQLYVKAVAVSEESKNRIWDAIKAVDPSFADLNMTYRSVKATKLIRSNRGTTFRKSANTSTVMPTNMGKF